MKKRNDDNFNKPINEKEFIESVKELFSVEKDERLEKTFQKILTFLNRIKDSENSNIFRKQNNEIFFNELSIKYALLSKLYIDEKIDSMLKRDNNEK